MKFTKMHGIGNDYVYVNCFQEQINHPEEVARRVSDRHFGIGSDGLILIKPSDRADFEMDMYNADGSRGAMCGNGIRCVAKYVYDYGLTDKTHISVATGSGVKELELMIENGKVARVKVDMGEPGLLASQVPVVSENDPQICPDEKVTDCPVGVGGKEYRMTCVSMGNPHCVVQVENVDAMEIQKIGPLFEHHRIFPDRVNTEFIEVLDRGHVKMRVWERGSGETLACGTGACAVGVACMENGWVDEHVRVSLRGGDLEILWDRAKNRVFMTGEAAVVFDGEITL